MEGDRLGPYTLVERVARGGMAEVWRARDEDGRVVCIKRLDPSLRGDVDFIEMFRDEAALVFDLDHENIVRMRELIDSDDELAQVMEFVDGPSLARIRANIEPDGGFSIAESLQIAIYLARALHHAHTRVRDGEVPLLIVHRDVSPQNILVDKAGHVKLVDFGIARAAQRLVRTQAGTLKGKLSYMAPEQARGGPLDHRADQFASGILLWEMLTGRRLFGGRNELLILEQVQNSDPVPPSSVKRGIPKSVDKAVLRALRWHPEERFPDMAAFERALQQCLLEIEPRTGKVELSDVVARAIAKEPIEKTAAKAQQGAQRTRVISVDTESSTQQESSSESSSEPERPVRDLFTTNPLAQPEHTGEFFRARTALSLFNAMRPTTVLAAGAGAAVVVAGIAAAVWFAERDTGADKKPLATNAPFVDVAGAKASLAKLQGTLSSCKSPCARPLLSLDGEKVTTVDAAELDACLARCAVPGAGQFEPPSLAALEQKLDKAPAHPCRTELLDDLLDKSPLSTVGRAAIADDVDQCVRTIADAPSLRAQLKPGSLQEPPPQKAKKRQKQKNLDAVHIAELEHRGQEALAVGEYGSAKELFASALQMAPDHVDDHALIAQAFRGLGDPAGAGYHLRLWLWARPDSPEAERAVRYLKRYNQQTELHPSTTPAVDERHARAARLLHDAEAAPDPIAPLEQARELLPSDARVLWRLGDAYAKAGRSDDARRALKAALADASPHDARTIRDHLSKLGS